jgi:hypothetical protein
MALISWALMAAAPYLPALSALRRLGAGLLVLVLVATAAWGVWQLRHLNESDRIAAAAQAIVDRANLKAENAALKAAAKQSRETLAERAASTKASEAAIAKLEKELKEARDASPDPDKPAVVPGDPWLDRGRQSGGLPKRP